jgi:tetratricopeptide (TPR) repeat protein
MTKSFFTVLFTLTLTAISAQEAKNYYEQGVEFARLGKADDAIEAFNKSIALKADEYVAWYNRGVAEMMVHRYEDALTDFDKTILLNPGYKKAYLNRGTTKKHLTDYDGALADYNYLLKHDTINMEAFYYRGLLYNLIGKRVEACMDFNKARRLGYKDAQIEVDGCVRRPIADDTSIHSILRLTRKADNEGYGFLADHPVRVGKGPESGPNNVRTYLELLRDANGKPLKYERIGTCCPYKSDHAFFGKEAMEEKYQITYTAADGSTKTAFVYLTFYDYEEPLILAGMKTVRPPNPQRGL